MNKIKITDKVMCYNGTFGYITSINRETATVTITYQGYETESHIMNIKEVNDVPVVDGEQPKML